MSFLSTQTLEERFDDLFPDVPQPSQPREASVELALGEQYYISDPNDTKPKRLSENDEYLSIKPGQFGLLITNEVVAIPNNLIAFISIKSKQKFNGLINVSGFHVDPGYKGKLKFTVYNAGPTDITLRRNDKLFIIWFSELDNVDNSPYKREGKYEINVEDTRTLDGQPLSASQLDNRLSKLELDFKNARGIATSVILLLLGSLVLPAVFEFYNLSFTRRNHKQSQVEERLIKLEKHLSEREKTNIPTLVDQKTNTKVTPDSTISHDTTK